MRTKMLIVMELSALTADHRTLDALNVLQRLRVVRANVHLYVAGRYRPNDRRGDIDAVVRAIEGRIKGSVLRAHLESKSSLRVHVSRTEGPYRKSASTEVSLSNAVAW